ncbi:MAG: phosphatase PAP2 family protein [Chryseosolibacter sp.]
MRRVAEGVYHNLSSALRWNKKDWTTTAIVLGSTAAISLLDEPVNRFWEGKQDPFLDVANEAGYWYGTPYSGMILTGGFYVTGLIFKNEWARETGLVLGTAFTTSTLIVSVFKPLVGRTRPGNGVDIYEFHPFTSQGRFHAFPSGHAIISCTLSLVLAKRINNTSLKIFFYTLAASTAFCRLYTNAHWLSDVALGGAIGWFTASNTNRHLLGNHFKKLRKSNVSMTPNLGGMTFRVCFN